MFKNGDEFGLKLTSADTDNYKIVWKMYHANLTLVLVETDCGLDDAVYTNKLDLLFDAIVLQHGLDDIINVKHIEKFQRQINVSSRYRSKTV
jgi:hypothetical protein